MIYSIIWSFLSISFLFIIFRIPIDEGFLLLFQGSLGSGYGLIRSLVKATPLLITALGLTISWQAKLFNIGGEGQFILGAMGTALFMKFFPQFHFMGVLCGGMAGALWAFIVGFLQIYRNVPMVFSTILMNFIAVQFLSWSLISILQEPDGYLPISRLLTEQEMLWSPKGILYDFHSGIILAIILALGTWFFIYKTVLGYKIRLVGENLQAARNGFLPVNRIQCLVCLLSGAFCGVAGSVEYLGITGQISNDFPAQWGFLAIPVTLLGSLNPLKIMLISFAFGILLAGSENLGKFTSIGPTLIYIIQAVSMLLFVWHHQKGNLQSIKMRSIKI